MSLSQAGLPWPPYVKFHHHHRYTLPISFSCFNFLLSTYFLIYYISYILILLVSRVSFMWPGIFISFVYCCINSFEKTDDTQ